jgi:hypothetical protein
MRKRWWIGGAAVVVAAALVGVAVWPHTGSQQEPPLEARLTDMQYETTDTYEYAQWWTDGSTTVRLTANGDDLVVNEPVARVEGTADPSNDDLIAVLPAAPAIDPAAIAALPGDDGAPWVAIALDETDDDALTAPPPLAWVANGRGDDEPAPAPIPLPVDLLGHTSSETSTAADAAVVRIGDTVLAVAATSQADAASLHACTVDACAWTPRELPGGAAIELLGSTGDGVVAITADRGVWYADDVDLSWERVGAGPAGMEPQVVQDGEGTATVVWLDRADQDAGSEDAEADTDDVAIQTISAGRLDDAVKRTPVDGGVGGILTATEVDDRWHLGGSRASAANISLPYPAEEPSVWTFGDDSWHALEDELLRNQPDQRVEALWVDVGGDLRALTTSPVQRITMVWRLGRDE